MQILLKLKDHDKSIQVDGDKIVYVSPKNFEEKVFKFNGIYDQTIDVSQNLDSNTMFIAYGQTQSGKSTTLGLVGQEGILHQIIDHALNTNGEFQVSIIAVDKKIFDLLKEEELKFRFIKDDAILNMSEVLVNDRDQGIEVIQSRCESTPLSKIITIKFGDKQIVLVDLVGWDEKGYRSQGPLIQIIAGLYSGNNHLPFRDSSLTFCLKKSFLSSRIIIIGTIECSRVSESWGTISTLNSIQRQEKHKPRSPIKQTPPSSIQKNKLIKVDKYFELSQYLTTLILKLNQHVQKLHQHTIALQSIDLTKPLEQIVNHIQQVSHELISGINSLQQQQPQISLRKNNDGWMKAIQFLYNTYEDAIQREDKLIKEKIIYIINDSQDANTLRNIIFPPRAEQFNGLYKTLGNLRKYQNTVQVPIQTENKKNTLISSIYQREVEKAKPVIIQDSPKRYPD